MECTALICIVCIAYIFVIIFNLLGIITFLLLGLTLSFFVIYVFLEFVWAVKGDADAVARSWWHPSRTFRHFVLPAVAAVALAKQQLMLV